MRDLEQRLARWVTTGLVTPEQAAAILAAEEEAPGERGSSMAATALGYLGASVALVGGVVAASREWSAMATGSRLALSLGATVLLLAAGFLARRRDHPALRSLDGFLWFLSAAGAAFTAGLVAHDVLDLETRSITFFAGGAAAAWGAPLWRLRRSPIQETAVFAGLGVFVEALLAHLPGPPDELHGLPLWGLGAVWAILAWGRILSRRSSLALAGVALLFGAQLLSFGWRGAGLALGIGTGVALLAASVALRSTVLLAFGAAGVLLFLPQIVFEYLGDTLGAPLALLVCGIAILGGAFAAARLKRTVGVAEAPTDDAATARGRRRAMLLAAGVALAVAAVVWGVGVEPIPDYASLAERPDPSIPGRVAFLRSGERPCVWVAAAAGGDPQLLACTDDSETREGNWLGGPVAWTREGNVAVQAFGPYGNRVLVIDPDTRRVVERIEAEAPLLEHADPAGGPRADGARILVNRSGRTATLGLAPVAASPREIARVTGPPGYGFSDPRWSPDGEWILVRDTHERLLVVKAREGSLPRVLAERVWGGYAWHVPGLPADVDLDSLRAAAARGRSDGRGRLASPPEGR
ncbi:MAG TPA: hypothetical protein VFQ21_13500 [Gemmatimonadota bacterium]|nr:hypothetical protein [Gemmatimonadota bacterium]